MYDKQLSNRQLKVGETIKRSLNDILKKDIHSLFLDTISIVISEVRMTPDLMVANVYILPMIGGVITEDQLFAEIKNITPQIRRALAKKVKLRYVPEIRYKSDSTFENASHLDTLLKK